MCPIDSQSGRHRDDNGSLRFLGNHGCFNWPNPARLDRRAQIGFGQVTLRNDEIYSGGSSETDLSAQPSSATTAQAALYNSLSNQSRSAAILSSVGAAVVLCALFYSGYKLNRLRSEVAETDALLAKRKGELVGAQQTLAQLDDQIAVRNLALSVVREKQTGPRPKITFYRTSVARPINEALGQLGFRVEQSEYPGNATVRNKPVDTIIYGCAVTNSDIQTIALALTHARDSLNIRRIAPAEHLKDPLLVQIVATLSTNSESPVLSADEIRAWRRKTLPCSMSPDKAIP